MKRLFVAFTVAIFATGLAAQELKNVRLLKGLTPTQLQRTMNMIRGQRGEPAAGAATDRRDRRARKSAVLATTPDGAVVNVINEDAGWIRDAKGTRPINPNQVEPDAVRGRVPHHPARRHSS